MSLTFYMHVGGHSIAEAGSSRQGRKEGEAGEDKFILNGGELRGLFQVGHLLKQHSRNRLPWERPVP